MRYVICVLSLLFVFASQGANSGSTFTNGTTGDTYWSSPENAQYSDNVYATCTLDDGVYSSGLRATGFGFSIPSGATIDGIMTEFELKGNTGFGQVVSSRVVYGGSVVGYDYSDYAVPTTIDEYYQYGGTGDLWGLSWTYSDINSSGFGCELGLMGTDSPTTFSCDHIRITVYYTVASTGVKHRVFGYGGGVTRDEVL